MKFITFLFKFRKYLKSKDYLTYLNPLFKYSKKTSIQFWKGGFGNNLLQVANIIIYSNYYEKSIYIPNHGKFIRSKLKELNTHNSLISERSNFFNLNLENEPFKNYYYNQISDLFENKVFNLFNFYKDLNLSSQELVIHLRPMAVVGNETFKFISNKVYIQNPLNYYLKLIKKFDKTTIVIENILSNPLLPILSKIETVNIKSGTVEEDYNYLLNAKNLVMSTNSTFGITAALASKKLEKLYYSSLNSNNKLIKAISCSEKYELTLENYIDIEQEYNLEKVFRKMLSDDVSVKIKKVS